MQSQKKPTNEVTPISWLFNFKIGADFEWLLFKDDQSLIE